MKKLCALLFLVSVSLPSHALELGVFELAGFTPLRGLIEPPPTNSASSVRARIILFPGFALTPGAVSLSDADGREVNAANFDAAKPPFRGYIRAYIARASPSDDEKLQILHEAYPNLSAPTLMKDRPPMPPLSGEAKVDVARMNAYNTQLRYWETPRLQYQPMLEVHQFLPSMPKNIEITARSGPDVVARYGSPKGAKSLSGPIAIPLMPDLPPSVLRPLLRDELVLEISFSIDSTTFQSLAGTYSYSFFSSSVAEALRKEMTSASTSSSGFLFWQTTSKRLATSVNESVSRSTQAKSTVAVDIRNYDTTDAAMLKLMDETLFPKTNVDVAIKRHEAAAAEAKKAGNTALENLHRKYVDSLVSAGDGGLGKGFDAYAALAALADGDLLKFVSAGFAFRETSGSSNLTIRRIATTSAADSEFRSFSSQLFSSLEQYFVINVAPPKGFAF